MVRLLGKMQLKQLKTQIQKHKLIAGEALTEAEADTIVL